MKVVNVNVIASPDKDRLVINDNVKFEADTIDYETLFRYIQNEAQGTVNLNLHYEWTYSLEEWDQDNSDVVVLTHDQAQLTTVGDPDIEEEEEEECEHLHVEDLGVNAEEKLGHRLECLDCGATGYMEFESD